MRQLVEVLISTDSSLLKWAEEFVEKFIIDLLLTYPDEMVSLIFSLPNGRRTAYYGVGKVESALWQAWSSDNAVSSHRMVSFTSFLKDEFRNSSLLDLILQDRGRCLLS